VFWDHLHKLLGRKLRMSSAYHPQTDGSTERADRTVTQMLRQCINQMQNYWVHKLPALEFAINSAGSESTGELGTHAAVHDLELCTTGRVPVHLESRSPEEISAYGRSRVTTEFWLLESSRLEMRIENANSPRLRKTISYICLPRTLNFRKDLLQARP